MIASEQLTRLPWERSDPRPPAEPQPLNHQLLSYLELAERTPFEAVRVLALARARAVLRQLEGKGGAA